MLEARGVFKYFGDFPALIGVTLSIARGEPVLLYGSNGAGKTTLLRVLASLSEPSEGEVLLAGKRVGQQPAAYKSRIGFVSHATFLYGDLTVRENLSLAAKLFDVPTPEKRIETVLDLFSIRDRGGQLTRDLSRGLQQRTTLARALLHDPDFLLLDEPFTGLDAESSAHLERLLRRLADEGKAVIFSTHRFAQSAGIARRCVLLERGRVRFDGAIEEAPRASFAIEKEEVAPPW